MLPESPSEECLRAIWALFVGLCSSMAAFTFTVYDLMTTIDEGINQIWSQPWTLLKSLYVAIRICAVVFQVIPAIFWLQMGPNDGDLVPSKTMCHALMTYKGVSTQLMIYAVQIVLILRVEALYRLRWLSLSLRWLFAAEVISMAVILGLNINHINVGEFCLVTGYAESAPSFLALPILYDLILFVLGSIKFYQAVREGWGNESVIHRFLRDGVWAFALPFVILASNMLCMIYLSGPLASIVYSWIIPVCAFAGYRLILNMSYLLCASSPFLLTTDPNFEFEVSRNLISADLAIRTTTPGAGHVA